MSVYKGSIVAIVTPMHDDFSIDYPSLERLIEFQIENKTDGIVAVGTTGESPTLSHQEHQKVIEFCVQRVKGRIPVIAGAGSNNTQEAIELAIFAKKVKADASLQVTPYYNKPTQKGMIHHFTEIAKNAPFDHILYNVPSRTNCDLLPETTIALSKISNIVGIKEAASDGPKRVIAYKNEIKDDFSILSGDDVSLSQFLKNGGHGVISVTANLAPQAMHDLCQYGLAADFEKLEALQNQLMDLHQSLFLEPSPTPLKWAMAELNLIAAAIRSPLIEFSQLHHQALKKAMHKAGLLSEV